MRRALLLLVSLAFLAAGCGGADRTSATGGGSKPAGAVLVSADVLAFVSIDSDLQSGQWQQLDELSKKFPGRDEAILKIERSLTKQGVDWKRDVEPALGPEFDVAVAGADASDVVGLTKPDDPAKFKALVDKIKAGEPGETAVTRDLGDGWWGIAENADMFTRVLKGDSGASLSSTELFTQAMDKLPGEALAKAYADGKRLTVALKSRAAKSGSGLDTSAFDLDNLDYVAASASAEDDGIRIHGATSGGAAGGGEAKLIDGVPGDAFALLDFLGQGTTDGFDKLGTSPQLGGVVDKLKEELGVPPEELSALLGGEVAFYVRPSALIPEFTLVLDPKDAGTSLATLDKIAAHVADEYNGRVTSSTEDGREVKTLDLGRISIRFGSSGGKIVVTTGANGIADYGSGTSLPDSGDFKGAKDAAGMPDSTGSVTYIDVKNLLPLLEGLSILGGHGLPPHVVDNLRPLRSFLAWSEGGSGERTYDAFLEIK